MTIIHCGFVPHKNINQPAGFQRIILLMVPQRNHAEPLPMFLGNPLHLLTYPLLNYLPIILLSNYYA
jgi:hypothetical protein